MGRGGLQGNLRPFSIRRDKFPLLERSAMSLRSILFSMFMLAPAAAQAQSVGDAISSALFENVIYSQAKLKVNADLLRLNRMAVANGGNHLALLADDGTIRVWDLLRGSQGK